MTIQSFLRCDGTGRPSWIRMEEICAGTTPQSSRLRPVDLPGSLSRWNHERGSNQAVQLTGASRFGRRQVERHRRLAPVADLYVRRDTPRSTHRDGHPGGLKGHETPAQGKRASRRASPWVNRHQNDASPERARQRYSMTRSGQNGAIRGGGERSWFCSAPSGLVGLMGRFTQGDVPPVGRDSPWAGVFRPFGAEGTEPAGRGNGDPATGSDGWTR